MQSTDYLKNGKALPPLRQACNAFNVRRRKRRRGARNPVPFRAIRRHRRQTLPLRQTRRVPP